MLGLLLAAAVAIQGPTAAHPPAPAHPMAASDATAAPVSKGATPAAVAPEPEARLRLTPGPDGMVEVTIESVPPSWNNRLVRLEARVGAATRRLVLDTRRIPITVTIGPLPAGEITVSLRAQDGLRVLGSASVPGI